MNVSQSQAASFDLRLCCKIQDWESSTENRLRLLYVSDQSRGAFRLWTESLDNLSYSVNLNLHVLPLTLRRKKVSKAAAMFFQEGPMTGQWVVH